MWYENHQLKSFDVVWFCWNSHHNKYAKFGDAASVALEIEDLKPQETCLSCAECAIDTSNFGWEKWRNAKESSRRSPGLMLFKGLNFDFVRLQNQSDSVYSSHWWKSWWDFDGFSKMWKVAKNCSPSKWSSWVPFPIPRPDRHDLCLQDIQEVSHRHRTNLRAILVWSETSKVELFSSRYPDIEWVATSSTPWIFQPKLPTLVQRFVFPKTPVDHDVLLLLFSYWW